MQTAHLKSMSLKSKMALVVAALFVLFVTIASYITLSFFERSFKDAIATQQRSLVSSLAVNIDGKLRIAQNVLIAVATTAPPDVFTNAEHAQRFLDHRPGLSSIFDNNTAFISLEGKLVAEGQFVPGRRGKDLSFREWFKKTLATGKPQISDPFISTHSPRHPVVLMTAPMFDKRGKMIGMIIGSIDLLGSNFLAEISNTRIGKGGYLYISDSNRILIVHPDKSRIMKSAASLGVNAFYDKAIKGFEGSGETITSYGVHMFSSCKRLRMTSWILVANFPIAEVYAPLYTAKRYFDASSIVLAIMLLIATWLITRRLMSPLATITRHVELLSQKKGDARLIAVGGVNEIGMLATAFNTMIVALDKQREAMEELNNSLEERIISAVAENRRKDQLLIQQNRQATMGEMINNIAHQWRQPLNNVGLIVQNMLLSFETGNLTKEGMKAEVATTMETILFMSRTIDDFRNFFRQDKEKRNFAITSILNVTIDFVSAGFRNSNIAVSLEVIDLIAAYGYPNEYSQVLLNILNNAKDVLTERRVGKPFIHVRLFNENGRAVVTVRDNGGGIAEDILPRIFDPYFSTKEPGKGTGIGLYMSKVIIEQNMGGSLSAYNVDGGAEFRIELPSAV